MHSIHRRTILAAFAALALGVAAAPAAAQQYPSQDIRLICGFAPGSGADILVRYYAEKLRPIAGKNVIVENKVGANSNIATEYVARSKPDGHVLYPFAGTTVAATMALFKNPPVDVGKMITVAATTSNLAFMLTVDAKSPYKTVAELTEAMKKKGDKVSYAVTSNPSIIMGAIYNEKAGLTGVEVLYKSGPDSMNDMASGRVDYGLHDPIFALGQVREGRLRVLAVSTSERLQSQPDIPTMTESGIPMDLNLWWGVMVPTGTPRPIIDKINAWFNEISRTEETRKFLALSGADPMIRTPDEAQAMFLKAIPEWADYVKLAKIPQN
jgi:tripartite-type tricarboxylate transporter receptor subunit TctC